MKWNKAEEKCLRDLMESLHEEDWQRSMINVFPHRSWDAIRKKIKRLRIEERLGLTGVRVFVFPDIHFPYQDDKALSIAEQACIDHDPEIIIILGDLIDCEAPSSFKKEPEQLLGLQDECDQAQAFLQRLRTNHPDARIILKEGNHEVRLKTILKNAHTHALSSLRCLRVEALLGLEELGIEYYDSETKLRLGNLKVTHGNVVRQGAGYTAHKEMSCGLSGISGHTHRLAKVWRTKEAGQTFWIEAGCLCKLDMGYLSDTAADWQQGFVLGWVDESEYWHLHPVEIINHTAFWNGKEYK